MQGAYNARKIPEFTHSPVCRHNDPEGPQMEKMMCYAAIGIGALMALVFVLDMVAETPFGGGDFAVPDFFGFAASLVVVYLGYNALKDQK
jgi:hypothetical protein